MKNLFGIVDALRPVGIALILSAACHGNAVAKDYPQMAAVAEYLIPDSNTEIAMARSAAPNALTDHATVLILTNNGYQTAINGTNGFTCLVERSWMSPFDSPEFWNPHIRGPICYNPPAVKTVLPYTLTITKLVLTGLPKQQVHEIAMAGLSKHEFTAPEVGAMSYMMSKDGNLGDSAGHWCPHLMFYVPKTDAASWGSDIPGSPVLYNDEYRDMPEPETIFMVAVQYWSDGSVASMMKLP